MKEGRRDTERKIVHEAGNERKRQNRAKGRSTLVSPRMVEAGTRLTLDLQDPSGQAPANGRTDDHVWVEVGWFWGRLGRDRVLLLVRGDVEMPSDLLGIEHGTYKTSPTLVTDFDASSENAAGFTTFGALNFTTPTHVGGQFALDAVQVADVSEALAIFISGGP